MMVTLILFPVAISLTQQNISESLAVHIATHQESSYNIGLSKATSQFESHNLKLSMAH